jgi:hypothetical protein
MRQLHHPRRGPQDSVAPRVLRALGAVDAAHPHRVEALDGGTGAREVRQTEQGAHGGQRQRGVPEGSTQPLVGTIKAANVQTAGYRRGGK